MNSTERILRLSNFALPLVLLWVTAEAAYAVFTGGAIGSDIHYNTLGRVLNGIGAIAALGFMLWSWRNSRRLQSRVEEDRKRKESDVN